MGLKPPHGPKMYVLNWFVKQLLISKLGFVGSLNYGNVINHMFTLRYAFL